MDKLNAPEGLIKEPTEFDILVEKAEDFIVIRGRSATGKKLGLSTATFKGVRKPGWEWNARMKTFAALCQLMRDEPLTDKEKAKLAEIKAKSST